MSRFKIARSTIAVAVSLALTATLSIVTAGSASAAPAAPVMAACAALTCKISRETTKVEHTAAAGTGNTKSARACTGRGDCYCTWNPSGGVRNQIFDANGVLVSSESQYFEVCGYGYSGRQTWSSFNSVPAGWTLDRFIIEAESQLILPDAYLIISPDLFQVVNVETWLALVPALRFPVDGADVSDGIDTVHVHAVPVALEFDPGDESGNGAYCTNFSQVWVTGVGAQSSSCTYTYKKSSLAHTGSGAYPAQARIIWDLTYPGLPGVAPNGANFPGDWTVLNGGIEVHELQSVNIIP